MLEDEFKTIDWDISRYAPEIKRLVEAGRAIPRVENFWTVGLATYKDGYSGLDNQLIHGFNNFLLSTFPELYADQLIILSDFLKAPVKYMENMPVPGFHVFKYCKEFEEPLARPHVDVPFNKYSWGCEVGHGDIFTHVAPVEVPDKSGMNYWDLTAMDMHTLGEDFIVQEARKTKPLGLIKYEIGKAIVHSGKVVHQIKPFEGPTDKWRITLQSHAVFKDGSWQLYW